MRTAEVGNWSGRALVCPRTELARLGGRSEVRRTGVYILVGPSDTSPSGLAVYVGEGDDVWSRLSSHDDKKDFWTFVVVFVSKDDNLTKAHVRWLEARLAEDISKAKRADVKNSNGPPGSKLPEADAADMETFYQNMTLLLPILGVSVFETSVSGKPPKDALALELKWDGASAECLVIDGQFVIQPGSTARVKEVDSLGDGSRAIRKALVEQGVLVRDPPNADVFRFTQPYAFDSPSGAAAVVSGTGLNGRKSWKVKGQGITYADWEKKKISGAADEDDA